MSYLAARESAFKQELLSGFYGSDITHKGVTYRAVGSSRAATKQMGVTNQMTVKPAVFDMPAYEMTLSDGTVCGGFDTSGIGLKSFIQAGGETFEVFTIQDDPKEPFVRLQCNRKQ